MSFTSIAKAGRCSSSPAIHSSQGRSASSKPRRSISTTARSPVSSCATTGDADFGVRRLPPLSFIFFVFFFFSSHRQHEKKKKERKESGGNRRTPKLFAQLLVANDRGEDFRHLIDVRVLD